MKANHIRVAKVASLGATLAFYGLAHAAPIPEQAPVASALVEHHITTQTSGLDGQGGGAVTIDSTYNYAAIVSLPVALDQPLPVTAPPQSYAQSPLGNAVEVSGATLRAGTGGMDGTVFAAPGTNAMAVAYSGSVISFSLSPHTSVTFTKAIDQTLVATAPAGYVAPALENPGVTIVTLSHLGSADDAALSKGLSPALFDPDADGYICLACDGMNGNWRSGFLSADHALMDTSMFDWHGSGHFTQTYSIENHGDTVSAYKLVVFDSAMSVNALPASTVPEPSAWLLIGSGLAALAGWRRLGRSRA